MRYWRRARKASLLLDQTEPIASEIAPLVNTQVPAILENVYNKAYNRCLGDNQTFNSNSTVDAQQVPLTSNTASLMYTGNGTLNYDSRIFTI